MNTQGTQRPGADPQRDLVSVVIPTYNGARHLPATLLSLQRQSYPNVEVIVVDDGSQDDSAELARNSALGAVVLSQPNLGTAVARNRGLARARGRWVGFLDQDDLWRDDRIETLVDYARSVDVAAVASTEEVFALASDRPALESLGDGREKWPRHWITEGREVDLITSRHADSIPTDPDLITVDRLLAGAATVTTSVLYDRETALAAGGFAPHARALDDHMLNLNVARIAGPIHRLDARDLFYRVHPESTTTVAPMVGPFLSAMASVRHGGVFPKSAPIGPNIEHLLFDLANSDLSRSDQLALLALSVPKGDRGRWYARWARRSIRRALGRSNT